MITLKVFKHWTDDDFVKYSGIECVQVTRDSDYVTAMQEQYDAMKWALEAEGWTAIIQWNQHDFWSYADWKCIYKKIQVDCKDVEFIGEYQDYGIPDEDVDYSEVI